MQLDRKICNRIKDICKIYIYPSAIKYTEQIAIYALTLHNHVVIDQRFLQEISREIDRALRDE
jgi:hypothetical protein